MKWRFNAAVFFATVLATAVPAAADDWGHLVAYGQWTNDYRFNGFSESNRQPVLQGGVHWLGPDGVYAGVFVSRVRFNDFRGTSVETDFYAGKHILWDDNDVNLEVLYGDFPDTAGHPTYLPPGAILPTYNFAEAAAEWTRHAGRVSYRAKVTVEPRPASHGGMLEIVEAGASYDVAEWLKASANVGHQWADNKPPSNHWDVGLTFSPSWRYALDVRYYSTDIAVRDCFNTSWCKPALVVKATYTFAIF